MPRLTVSPAIDGTWVRLVRPDGSCEYHNEPLALWHAIVGQPGRGACDGAALGLFPAAPLDPSCVRPEWVRLRAMLARAQHNAASLPAGTAPAPAPAPGKPSKPSKLRVPKWAREPGPSGPSAADADAETACL